MFDARLIEAERERLWRRLARGTAGGLVRASSLSLLVILTDSAIAARVRGVLDEVAAQQHCRAMIVTLADDEPAAHVVVHAGQTGQPRFSWEEIKLVGPLSDSNRIMSAVELLTLPGLPVQAWWPGDPRCQESIFRRVVDIADRVIVDSRDFSEPLASIAWYASQSAEEHGIVGFVDLGWRRLEAWRVLLAQFFDPPVERLFLNDVQSIAVEYRRAARGEAGGLAEALLLVGWFAARLGWSPVSEPGRQDAGLQRLLFDTGASQAKAMLRSRGPTPRGGGLLKVEVRAAHAGRSALYTIARSEEHVSALARVDGARRGAELSLPVPGEADLLGRELAGFGRDRMYEEALQMMRSIAAKADPSQRL